MVRLDSAEGARPSEIAGVVATFALALASWPGSLFPSWTPKMAVLLLIGTPGLVVLIRRAARRENASVLAVTCLAWVWLTALASNAPRSSMIGFIGRDLSALTVSLSFGCWAIGRSLRHNDVLLTRVFIWAAALVSAIGLIQLIANVEYGFLALQSGRPASLLVNPVYFGAVSAAGCAAAVAAARKEVSGWEFACAAALTAAGVSLSGSRVAILGLVLSLAVLLSTHRKWTHLRTGACAVAGLLAGAGLTAIFDHGRSATSRFAQSGTDGRLSVWRYGIEAFFDRPLLGHGIGLFRSATQSRFGHDFVRRHAVDDLSQPWFDPHNVIVLILSTTGIIGLALVVAWLVLAAKDARGPLMWAVIPIAASWMLQPLSIHTMPLALLLLGVAAKRWPPQSEHESGLGVEQADASGPIGSTSPSRAWESGAMVLGALAAGWILLADFRLERAVDDVSAVSAESAARWYWQDPIAANVVAQVHQFDGNPPSESIRWRRRATESEPDRPYWWTLLGAAQLRAGEPDAAMMSARRALDLQATNVRGHELLLAVTIDMNDEAAAATQLRSLCQLSDRWCGVTAHDLLPAADMNETG